MNETFSPTDLQSKRWKDAKDKPQSDWRGLECRYDPSSSLLPPFPQSNWESRASGKQNKEAGGEMADADE